MRNMWSLREGETDILFFLIEENNLDGAPEPGEDPEFDRQREKCKKILENDGIDRLIGVQNVIAHADNMKQVVACAKEIFLVHFIKYAYNIW